MATTSKGRYGITIGIPLYQTGKQLQYLHDLFSLNSQDKEHRVRNL